MSFPLSRRNPFRPVYSGYSLFSALEILAREPSLHRVPVIDRGQHLINIITQSQLVSIVEQHLEIMGTLKDTPLSHIPTVWTKVLSVKETDTAMTAFNLMAEHHVSGVAVLDDKGELVNNLSLRDLKQVSADASMFWRLFQDVKSMYMSASVVSVLAWNSLCCRLCASRYAILAVSHAGILIITSVVLSCSPKPIHPTTLL
jgi:CBS-domain-containing membrane protein